MSIIVKEGCKPEIAQENITCWKCVKKFNDEWKELGKSEKNLSI